MEARGKESWPSEEGAREYLQKHKIIELFEEISAHLLYRQPGKLNLLKCISMNSHILSPTSATLSSQ